MVTSAMKKHKAWEENKELQFPGTALLRGTVYATQWEVFYCSDVDSPKK